MRKRPNFLICGAAQSGTSSLAASLVQHPDVFMPARTVPEPHHFLKSWEYTKGLDAYLDTWFNDVAEETAVGEKSSSYLFGGRTVARRIKRDLPGVRIIVILRNPVERTWAHYRFTALNGLETLSFDDALRAEAERVAAQSGKWAEIQPFNYTGRSFYARQLEPFIEEFGRARVLILKSEAMSGDRQGTFESVFRFLEVDPTFQPRQAPVFRSGQVINAEIQAHCREVFGDRFGEVLKYVRAGNDSPLSPKTADEVAAIELLKSNVSSEKSGISEWSHAYLTDLFHEDLGRLQGIVDFDIDDWGK